MVTVISLPRLNRLNPSLHSTLLKLTEEAGELARAVLQLLAAEERQAAGAADLLTEVTGELLDVAQTCVTMLFVLEEHHATPVQPLVEEHLAKLAEKGYSYNPGRLYCVADAGNYKQLALPRLAIPNVSLLTTVCKIQEELGELTQYLGKGAGASGEQQQLPQHVILRGSALELLDIAQCCFTMMYLLAEQYGLDMAVLTAGHVEKLRRKGYCD